MRWGWFFGNQISYLLVPNILLCMFEILIILSVNEKSEAWFIVVSSQEKGKIPDQTIISQFLDLNFNHLPLDTLL